MQKPRKKVECELSNFTLLMKIREKLAELLNTDDINYEDGLPEEWFFTVKKVVDAYFVLDKLFDSPDRFDKLKEILSILDCLLSQTYRSLESFIDSMSRIDLNFMDIILQTHSCKEFLDLFKYSMSIKLTPTEQSKKIQEIHEMRQQEIIDNDSDAQEEIQYYEEIFSAIPTNFIVKFERFSLELLHRLKDIQSLRKTIPEFSKKGQKRKQVLDFIIKCLTDIFRKYNKWFSENANDINEDDALTFEASLLSEYEIKEKCCKFISLILSTVNIDCPKQKKYAQLKHYSPSNALMRKVAKAYLKENNCEYLTNPLAYNGFPKENSIFYFAFWLAKTKDSEEIENFLKK